MSFRQMGQHKQVPFTNGNSFTIHTSSALRITKCTRLLRFGVPVSEREKNVAHIIHYARICFGRAGKMQ